MKILLLCEDYYHPGEVPVEGVKYLEKKGYTFDIIKDANDFDPEKLKDYPVVILSKSNQRNQEINDPWMTEKIQEAFVNYVENGGGLIAVHNATVPSETSEALNKLIGSKFVFHPNNCPVTVQTIKPHPVTKGVEQFTEIDEHYRLEILTDDVDILMASYSPSQGEEEKYTDEPYFNTTAWIDAACYVRTQGKGRICVILPGHIIEVWLNPEFQKLLENAINWVKS
ncbi:MAG: ThuA domain-containing protein [Oscillospiraceae bacterium]|jgi:type 1 glutamine amidotransferase|nr:ThuA domain-containing protein [Oscillospiraceae bacterium]